MLCRRFVARYLAATASSFNDKLSESLCGELGLSRTPSLEIGDSRQADVDTSQRYLMNDNIISLIPDLPLSFPDWMSPH